MKKEISVEQRRAIAESLWAYNHGQRVIVKTDEKD
jgi:hypothetical protein